MSEWQLRDPWFLLAALLAPLVFWLARRTPAAVTYSTLGLLDAAPRSLRSRLTSLPPLGLALAVVAMSVAMAGPRVGDSQTRVKREGIAICMVVDRSGSMRALDLQLEDKPITRLEAVKRVFRDFVVGQDGADRRPDDLIGLVGFATWADGLCPLTLDHGNLAAILEQMTFATDQQGSGTAIGEGLALGVERLREHPARSKVVILLTDGVNNAGDIAPLQAAELAAAHGIRVYTIGAGTDGVAMVEVEDQFGRQHLQPTRVEIDEQTLQQIAERTSGRYFRATDGPGLQQVVAEIDQLERSEIVELRYLNYRELFAPFVLGALALIFLAGISSATVLRRLP
jgi:Ca-activated chloride channel family protein